MKVILVGLLIVAGVALCSCREVLLPKAPTPAPALPPPAVTDTKPVGDGLKVLGYALVGAAVVVTVGRITR